MRKLIEISQDTLIKCDNKKCNFTIPNTTGDVNADTSKYINMPCPQCSENLLTEEDHILTLNFLKTAKWLNKWFSWITIFLPKKLEQKTTVNIHNGIHIQEEKLTFLDCMGCGKEFKGPEPQMCCNGRDCGCMGMSIEPVVCSQACYDKVVNNNSK